MTEHNKIPLAGEMLVQAVNSYSHAPRDIDYVTSILLAGAVIGIIAPLLKELDIKSSQVALAELSVKLNNSPSSPDHGKKIGRAIGNNRSGAGKTSFVPRTDTNANRGKNSGQSNCGAR